MQALVELSRPRLQIQEEHGIYQGNLIEEAQAEPNTLHLRMNSVLSCGLAISGWQTG